MCWDKDAATMVLRGKLSKQTRQLPWASSSKRTRCLPLPYEALLLLLVGVV
jgi:hypothetical protein